MLTQTRHKMGRFAWIVMALMAMTMSFAIPSTCASAVPGAAPTDGNAAVAILSAGEGTDACHSAPSGGHCGMNGPCCPPSAPAEPSDPAQPQHPASCYHEAEPQPSAILTAPVLPLQDLAVALLATALTLEQPAPVPAFHATDPLRLPPRNVVTRPWGSRAPPTFLA